eukprot:UC1_evm2s1176
MRRVQNEVQGGMSKEMRKKQQERDALQAAKRARQMQEEMMGKLFTPLQTVVKKGEDPSSIICAFFKAGACAKGKKCKFSHDLTMARKGAKINVYADKRDAEKEEKEKDNIEDWDEAKLAEVVKKKHSKQKIQTTTNIICKHFLDALEKSIYGWFWICPNGGDECKYRHALPEGYVLKKDRKKQEAYEKSISIEDLIEEERAALGPNTTPITLESFTAWKRRKIAEKRKAAKKAAKDKKGKVRAGRTGQMTGRDLFALGAVDKSAGDASAADILGDIKANRAAADKAMEEYQATAAAGEEGAAAVAVSVAGEKERDTTDASATAAAAAAAAATPVAVFDASVFVTEDFGDLNLSEGEEEGEEEEAEAAAATAEGRSSSAGSTSASASSGGGSSALGDGASGQDAAATATQ